MWGGAMDKNAHGVGESFGSLVLRARLISRRSSPMAGGVGGPRAHASRTASTSEFEPSLSSSLSFSLSLSSSLSSSLSRV